MMTDTHAAVSPTAVRCILCGATSLRVVERLPAEPIHKLWLEKYDIPVRQYFPDPSITNFECRACGLDFFYPQSPGDDRMYEQLQRFDWYYEENKWEFRASLSLLGAPGPALEVGCGTGNFLRALRGAGFNDVCGLDSNRRALEAAERQQIPVYERLEQLDGRRFDYVFAFQVLEHVSDPRSFLETLASLLSDRGRLFVAVPNQDSFIGDGRDNELNRPPHHCSRFRAATLRGLNRFLPLECEQIMYEPLSPNHVGWYVSTRMQSLPPNPLVSRVAWRTVAPLAELVLKFERARRLIKGHTVLAVLRRSAPAPAPAGGGR